MERRKIEIDLITGFLGAGKTTFLKKYAAYWLEQGKRLGILENDFGAVNVDMLLLQELSGEQCEVEMIVGSEDKQTHIRRLKTKLISMGMRGFDRILVEPSGIFDVDELFDILAEEPLDGWYELGNVIGIVDAGLETELSEASDFMLASQLADAGVVLLSKTAGVCEADRLAVVSHINQAVRRFQGKRCFQLGVDVFDKEWSRWQEEDFRQVARCGYRVESYVKPWLNQKQSYTSLFFFDVALPEKELVNRVKKLFSKSEYGRIYRVKGFWQNPDGRWKALNVTKREFSIEEIEKGQQVLIVIGEGVEKEKIQNFFQRDETF